MATPLKITPEMIEAGARILYRFYSLDENILAEKVFRAMLDAQTSGTNPPEESGPQPVRNVYPLDSEYK